MERQRRLWEGSWYWGRANARLELALQRKREAAQTRALPSQESVAGQLLIADRVDHTGR